MLLLSLLSCGEPGLGRQDEIGCSDYLLRRPHESVDTILILSPRKGLTELPWNDDYDHGDREKLKDFRDCLGTCCRVQRHGSGKPGPSDHGMPGMANEADLESDEDESG